MPYLNIKSRPIAITVTEQSERLQPTRQHIVQVLYEHYEYKIAVHYFPNG